MSCYPTSVGLMGPPHFSPLNATNSPHCISRFIPIYSEPVSLIPTPIQLPPGNHAHSFKAKFIYVSSYVNSIRCDTSLEVKTKGTLEHSLWHTRVLSPPDAWVSSSTAELLNYARLLLILSLGTRHFICLTLSWHLCFAKSSFLFKSVYLLVFSGQTFLGHPPNRTVLSV